MNQPTYDNAMQVGDENAAAAIQELLRLQAEYEQREQQICQYEQDPEAIAAEVLLLQTEYQRRQQQQHLQEQDVHRPNHFERQGEELFKLQQEHSLVRLHHNPLNAPQERQSELQEQDLLPRQNYFSLPREGPTELQGPGQFDLPQRVDCNMQQEYSLNVPQENPAAQTYNPQDIAAANILLSMSRPQTQDLSDMEQLDEFDIAQLNEFYKQPTNYPDLLVRNQPQLQQPNQFNPQAQSLPEVQHQGHFELPAIPDHLHLPNSQQSAAPATPPGGQMQPQGSFGTLPESNIPKLSVGRGRRGQRHRIGPYKCTFEGCNGRFHTSQAFHQHLCAQHEDEFDRLWGKPAQPFSGLDAL
jgi:hypothetical protein